MRSIIGLLLILSWVLPEARAADPKPQISCRGNERNLRTYLKIHEILFTQRDASRVTEFYADEVISHNLDSGGGGARTVKPEQLAAMWNASKRNNPERRLVDELILCSGDFVTVRTWVHSQDTTGMAGNPPTGKPYKISAIDIYRFKDGKVVERWGNSDLMSLAEQVGLRLVPVESKP